MRFCSINIFSGENKDGQRKRAITGRLREDSEYVLDTYLQSFKYYNNENCISLNISCDEDIDKMFIEQFTATFAKGYPILHIPFDLDEYSKIEREKIDMYWFSIINDSIEYVCDAWGWDREFFKDVNRKCLESFGWEIDDENV